ncbi:MAG: Lsm family RNA-binding protein [Nitrososphaerota archaeon]|nr:Lsm family RNA-binding protein [Aigarchaeota archaeon]MDW8077165.1 Lsm family RNA-binding protein [Nitrososphaerota archaeon]
MALPSKRFSDEFAALIDKVVRVSTVQGIKLEGKLLAYNPSDYSIWLADVKDESGNVIPKVFLSGSNILMIETMEAGIDMQKLAERLNRVFPNMVKYIKEADVILVMDRIRVTRSGVIEGSGPAAERVQKVFEEFVKEEAK